MTTRHIARLSYLILTLSGAACGSAALDAKSAHDAGEGKVRVFDATPQELWTASHVAVKWSDVGAFHDHPLESYFVTDPERADQVGVWVEPAGPAQTKVTVVVMDDPTLPGPDEQTVLKDIGTALALIRTGQPVDKRP